MLGILAWDVAVQGVPLADFLTGAARRFRPHVTLMPRTPIARHLDLRVLLRDLVSPSRIMLNGPRSPAPGLFWYECDPGQPGHDELVSAHHRCMKVYGAPHGPYTGRNYRPHLTIAAGSDPPPKGLPEQLVATCLNLSLYRYGPAPDHGNVERIALA